jgi:hypothetical protein
MDQQHDILDVPRYPPVSIATRLAAAAAAISVSTALIGGMLGLVEMHAEDAMIAKGSIEATSTMLAAAPHDESRAATTRSQAGA